MHLDPLYIQVLPQLRDTGNTEHTQGALDVSSIVIGHRHFDVPKGILYDANLVNTGEAVLLSGTATAELQTNCDRCLEPAQLNITGEIQGYFLFDKASVKDGESLEEYEEVDKKGRVDIAPPLLAAIVFEIPTVALCKPDCEGIEGVEVFDDSESSSDAEEHGTEEGSPPSPFAALKDFKFEE